MLRLLRVSDYRRMPWKNGGGETVEISVFPPDAGLDAFDWRVSTATVAEDGAFSAFPGIDRTLSVLQGTLRLAVDGRDTATLGPDDDPLPFPADIAVFGWPVAGPVIDLNAMTRRGRFQHDVEPLRSAQGHTIPAFHGCTLLYCRHGRLSIATSDGSMSAGEGETLFSDRPTTDITIKEQEGLAYLIRISASL